MDYTNTGQVENAIKYRMRETIVSLQQNPVGKSRLTINRNEMKKQVTKRSFCFKIIIILSSRTCFFILLDSRSGSSQCDV